ncbi:Hpt domain-containing protein [Marinagarivorans algicola]|uniref:Hpt domain-containing protein n=1 Tax=Marinagarivorans algicola TaxID=1513270 RepID=UPI0006B56D26|nr:Hpt domain-containing protein [Marinagarivorans algicola]
MSEAVNLDVLDELKELLDDGFPLLVERFVADGQERVDKILLALEEQNPQLLYTEAHGLKGSSRNIGAGPLADLCGQLEAMGHANDLTAAETIVAALKTEFSAACQVIIDH